MQSAGYTLFWQGTVILAILPEIISADQLAVPWYQRLWFLLIRRFPPATFVKNIVRDLRGVRR